MFEWLRWLAEPGNGKTVILILFLSTFCAILGYVFTGKRRAKRLESYKYIPFQDDDPPVEPDSQSRKVVENERNEQ
jgi:cbb3-type cytochrome oxidase subunit 3